VLQGYEVYYPDQPRIIVARNRDDAAVSAALMDALTLAQRQSCARIWLARTHVDDAEAQAWALALHHAGVTTQDLGHGGLSVIQPSGSGCP
jgi:hypothetical protein